MAIEIRKPLRKYLPYLLKGKDENLNEADTVQRVVKVFEDVLGYDPMSEITRERLVKEKYADIAIKVDGTIRFFVEVKAAGRKLRDRDVEQAERYAAESNVAWVLLTNGVAWNLYHLTFDEGIDYERVFTIDLSTDPFETAAERLALLHRQSVRHGDHEKFWEHEGALRPESIGRALFTYEVMRFIRREIRRREGVLIDEEDLASAIHAMLSPEARESIGPVKLRRKRSAGTTKPKVGSSPTAGQTPTTAPGEAGESRGDGES